MLESLEGRQLFLISTIIGSDPPPPTSTHIFGEVFFDKDHNGQISDRLHDTDDGMPGVRVYLDDNQNNRFDKGERFRITDANGSYDFGDIPQKKVAPKRLVLAQGQKQTSDGVMLGRFGVWSLQRNAFFSLDAAIENPGPRIMYGSDSDVDVLVGGVRVYVDLNRNGKRDKGEPTGNTTGNATTPTLLNVAPGKYQLRMYAPEGYKVDRRYVDVHVGDRETRAWRLRMSPTKTLGITFYRDENLNGRRDPNERRRAWDGGANFLVLQSVSSLYHLDIYRAPLTPDSDSIFHLKLPPQNFSIGHEQSASNQPISAYHWQLSGFDLPANWADGTILEFAINADQVNPIGLGDLEPNVRHGVVFFDKDRGGTRGDKHSVDDVGVAGAVVFFDNNRDGNLDDDEVRATTDQNGEFTLSGFNLDDVYDKPRLIVLKKGQILTTKEDLIQGSLGDIGIWSR